MECKNCGYKLKNDENICPRCGYSFDLKKYKNKKAATIAGTALGASALAVFIVDTVKKIKSNDEKQFIVSNGEIRKFDSDNNVNTNQVVNENISETNENVNNQGTDTLEDEVYNKENVITNETNENVNEQVPDTLEDEVYNKENIITNETNENVNEQVPDTLEDEVYNKENVITNETNENINDQVPETLGDETYNKENVITNETNENVNEQVPDTLGDETYNKENVITNEGNEYEATLKTQLEESGMSEEEISQVMEAYTSGDQEKFNEVISEINAKHAEEYEQNLVNQLKDNGLTNEEISSVVDAYKTGDENKVNEVLKGISDKHALESEKEMRESLAESGLTKEEIDRVVEVSKTGGSEEANKVLNQIRSDHAKEYEEQLINQLRANNVDENTINRMIQAYRNGDQDGMNAIYAEINEQKENAMRVQLKNSGMSNSQVERIITAYKNGDQDAINKVYAEIAQAKENEFIEQLRESGVTNEDDLNDARVAYRSGNQDTLNKTLDEISNSYLKPDASGDINIPSCFHVEALLSQFGASSRFSGSDITKVSQGDITYENFQTQFKSISDEYENGNFRQFDKEGVNKFANIFWDGSSYKTIIDNYYKFLGTLKNDLLTLKNTLVKLEGGELNYYNSINTEMAFEIMDSEGNPNMEFYNQLTTLGISDFGDDGVATQSEIVEFNNDLFSQLGNYYNDGNNGVESYQSEKLAVYGQDLDSQIKNYENTASTIVILMNQAAIKGLVDLDSKYSDTSTATLNDFTQAQFNQMCRDNNGNLKFSDMDIGAMQLGIAIFNKELSTSVSNGADTDLYLEYINGITNYAERKNCNLDPTEYAYTLLRSSVIKEAYTSEGLWRADSTSQAYKDCVDKYQYAASYYSFKDYLAMNGFADARTNTGNNVVDLFSRVIGKSSEERLNRSLEYGSNFEEAFYLSREYYDAVSPEFTKAYNDFAEFSKTLSDENATFIALDLYNQSDSVDLVEQMKDNPLYSHMFDSNGNLTGDYANISNLKDGDRKTILQKEMTEAILQSRLAIKNKEYINLINQMQLFNTFVSSSYEGVKNGDSVSYKRSKVQEKGLDLYLDYVNKENDINDYLKSELISYDDFANDSELISKYGDYKTYCYSFDNIAGSRYAEVEEYLKATTNSIEEFNELNNTFNDNIINVALNSSQIKIGCTQFHEALLGSFSQESGKGKMSEMLQGYTSMQIANNMNETAMYTSIWNKEAGQSYYDQAMYYYEDSTYHYSESNKFADMKHQYSDLQLVTTDIINNLQYETINFTSKYSYFDDYVNQYKEDFKNYHLNSSVIYDEYDGTAYTTYEWVDENGEKVEVSDEQLALMYLMAEQNGTSIDWNGVDKSITKYTENIKYLQNDEKTNYDGVLNYLMFSNIKDSESFSQQIVNFSNLGFDTEARRRADEYTSDFAAKMFSKLLNTEFSDNSELTKKLGKIGLLSSAVEWLFEDAILPALHGVDGFIKSIGYAVGDIGLAITGNEDKIDFSPSLNDQMWSYIIQNYKDNGGLDIANYYVTQAMISLGNQAIPIAVSCIPGMQWAGMFLLGISAFGNSFHSTLNEFINDGRSDTGVLNAFAYALMDASAEVFLEKFVGRMPGLSDAVSIGVKGLLKDIAGEMIEESLQEFLGPLFKDVATLDIFRSIGKGEFGDYVLDFMGNKVDLEAIRDSAIIAAISSGIMNGAQNGPAIIQSLIMTNGKSSSLVQLLQLQAQAMAKAGFTQEQISEQISINQNAAILNAANLTEISQNLLNNPAFETEFNNWKESLSKEDPRSEFNIEDYAGMKAIQSLTYDTTELAMAQNVNNSKIQELQNVLLKNNKNIIETLKYKSNENIIEQINELNTINANISEQISSTQLQAQQLINTNTNTITDLQSQITTLIGQLETSDVEQRNSITEKINNLQSQINVLNIQNNFINLSLADNLNALELTIDNNSKLLETLNEQLNGDNLEQSVIDVLNKQIEIINQNQQELNNRLIPARESLAKRLVSEEAQLLQTLYSLNEINKENTEDLKSWEKSKYQKIQNQIDQINNRLNEIQNQFESLEQSGIAIDGRTTYENIVKSNQEFDSKIENITVEHISGLEENVDESNIITENNSNQIVEDINFEIKGLEITPGDILSITAEGLNNIATKIKNIYITISANISQFSVNQKTKLIESLRNLSNNLKNSVKNMSNSLYEATIGKINSLIESLKNSNNSKLNQLYNSNQFEDLQSFITLDSYNPGRNFYSNYVAFNMGDFDVLSTRALLYDRYINRENVEMCYWTGTDRYRTNETGAFLNFSVGNEPRMPFRNSYKIYVPVDPSNFTSNCTEVLDFLIDNNIASDNKIANCARADAIVLRIYDINDAVKVLDFINQNPNITGTVTGIPLARRYGKVSLAMDGLLSYNSTASTLLESYINSNYQDRSIDEFRAYIDNILTSVYHQGNIEPIMNIFGKNIHDTVKLTASEILTNYMQVIGLLKMALDQNSGIDEYFSYCYANQDVENVQRQIGFFQELYDGYKKGDVKTKNNNIDYSKYSLEQRIKILEKIASDKGMSLKELGSQKGTGTIISPAMQSQADYFAKVIKSKAEMVEPTITSMMKKLEVNGAKLVGLDYRLKGIESLSRKILSDSMDLNQPLNTAASNIGDSIRYTLIIDEANYSTQVNDSLIQLMNEGYVIRKIKNFWGDPIYQGINTSIVSPDGVVFELQFHTADSFNTKEKLNHLYYEIARNKFTTIEEKDLANSIMKEYQSRVKIPEGILGYNSVINPIKKLNTVDEMFSYFSEGNGNYGIDQGLFTNLRKTNPDMYKKMKTKLINEYRFSRLDAERFMSIVDAIGACNYAAEVNAIIAYFRNMPDKFEKIFGFPLYVKNPDGKLSLNDAEILADLYYWGNTHSKEAVLFRIDENGTTTFNEEAIGKNDMGKITMVMQRGGGMNETLINEYLHSKSSDLHCSLTEVYENIDNTTLSHATIKEDLLSRINNGEEIVMGSASTGVKPIIYTEIKTGNNYAVSGGHWVKVTEVTDNGVIVSSWGKRCLVKFEDLQANAYFDFYSLKFSIK